MTELFAYGQERPMSHTWCSGTLYCSYHSASPITGSLAYPLPASCGMNSAILDFAPAFVSVSTNHW